MNSTPPVRFARVDEAAIEAALVLVEAYYAFDHMAFDATAVRRGLAELVGHPSYGSAWIVQRGDHAVGYFVLTFGFDLEFGGRVATVTELFLVPSARRVGVGRAVLARVEAILRDAGVRAYELQVSRDNAAARAFYERLGFKAHDRIPLSKTVR